MDSLNNVHSIDMVYIEYFSFINPKGIIKIVQQVHEKYPSLSYLEMLGKKPQNKFDYYLDAIAIGGVYVSAGKYSNYDKVSGTFDLLPMFKLQVNPNKHYEEEWFQELLGELLKNASGGILRKYDYAIDIPKEMRFVEVMDSKKEKGLYKGTRYFGQAGRHGYLKIYDKQKDMKRQKVDIGITTRVEHTFLGKDKPSLEKVYILGGSTSKVDYSKLKDTEIAIVEMYLQLKALGCDYPLKLGRVMRNKLREYLEGEYTPLQYGDILERLLENIKKVFQVDGSPDQEAPTDKNGYITLTEAQQQELDELFGG